jgi:hypothetical protein
MSIWIIATCCDRWNVLASLSMLRMFNVIGNELRFIKHIQNKLYGGLDINMINDSYQAPFMKDSWIFQNIKYIINALTSNFWWRYV